LASLCPVSCGLCASGETMLTLYLTQPVASPVQSGEDANEAILLAFYQAQCVQGGKRLAAANYERSHSERYTNCE
jgi:hypothetical protein